MPWGGHACDSAASRGQFGNELEGASLLGGSGSAQPVQLPSVNRSELGHSVALEQDYRGY